MGALQTFTNVSRTGFSLVSPFDTVRALQTAAASDKIIDRILGVCECHTRSYGTHRGSESRRLCVLEITSGSLAGRFVVFFKYLSMRILEMFSM